MSTDRKFAQFEGAAAALDCDPRAVATVLAHESGSRGLPVHFYQPHGAGPLRRFEPHRFSRRAELGWTGGWRTWLRTGPKRRAAMFEAAHKLDPEAACRACSWGAPQIMGGHFALLGYSSARDMVEAFHSIEAQLDAFVTYCKATDAGEALRARDWLTFAGPYNGTGQPAVYAKHLEETWRAITGEASPVVLRVGATGNDVIRLQAALAQTGYMAEGAVDGVFGPGTLTAVREAQRQLGCDVDGVVGPQTWAALARHSELAAAPNAQPTTASRWADRLDKVTGWLAGGGVAALAALKDEADKLALALGVSHLQLLAFVFGGALMVYGTSAITRMMDRRMQALGPAPSAFRGGALWGR